MRILQIFVATAVLILYSSAGFSQEINTEKLNSYLETLAVNDKFMGSVAVSKNGKIIYAKATGYADVDKNMKPNADTRYRVGSISKTFTATLVFKAIEEGKLSLDETLKKYFPEIKNADKITMSNLLNHRSGIYNFTNDKVYMEYMTQPISEAKLIEYIVKGGSDFKPNSKASYSNSNYVLLSLILQKVYKKPYAALLEEKIISPLDLKNTVFGKKINSENNEAFSYNYVDKWQKETETDMSVPLGAGSVVSTPSDLSLFATALFKAQIISAESLKTMMTLKDDYGMGLFKMPFDEKSSYGHTGAIDGFSSVFGYFIEDGIGFAIISNGNNYNQNSVTIAVLSEIFNKPYEIPSFKQMDLSAKDLEKYIGVYSTKELPIKLTISTNDNTLIGQATGQSPFPLAATGEHVFSFDQAGVVLEFKLNEKTVRLKQGGGSYLMTKEK